MKTYNDLRCELLKNKKLFEDPDFATVDSSLYVTRKPPRVFEWKRPKEICSNPQLFVDSPSRLDIKQGYLADNWFLAAVSSLAVHESLFIRICPIDQGFDDEQYCGAFKFNLSYKGKWTEVIIDDRLPTYKNELVFGHSPERNEFWVALLEKAYAKLFGCYEALKAGEVSEAMEDLTGGLGIKIDLQKPPSNLFKIMSKAHARNSLMGCSINTQQDDLSTVNYDKGLVSGIDYSITSVLRVEGIFRGKDVTFELVRLRNPYGNDTEWRGSWSDGSDELNYLSDKQKKLLGITFENNGEFWMSFKDFCSNFNNLVICYIDLKNYGVDVASNAMDLTVHYGSWKKGSTAGGCKKKLDSFANNPQYRFVLTRRPGNEDYSLTIALKQLGRRETFKINKMSSILSIGFYVYKVAEDCAERLNKVYFDENSSFKSTEIINSLQIIGDYKLSSGEYCIIPTTFNVGDEGEFMLRIFVEKADQPRLEDSHEIDKLYPDLKHEVSSSMNALFKKLFDSISGDNEEINPFDLQKILFKKFNHEIDIDTVKLLVSAATRDYNSTLNCEEFKRILLDVEYVTSMFSSYDRDGSNDLDIFELKKIMVKLGFLLSGQALMDLTDTYGNKRQKLSFSSVVEIITLCRQARVTFKKYATIRRFKKHGKEQMEVKAHMDFNQFVEFALLKNISE